MKVDGIALLAWLEEEIKQCREKRDAFAEEDEIGYHLFRGKAGSLLKAKRKVLAMLADEARKED